RREPAHHVGQGLRLQCRVEQRDRPVRCPAAEVADGGVDGQSGAGEDRAGRQLGERAGGGVDGAGQRVPDERVAGGRVNQPGSGRYKLGHSTSPPSTPSTCPVTKAASSLIRKRITRATSTGSPNRRSAVLATRSVMRFSGRCAIISVLIMPGATALTRMPRGPSSFAAVRATVATAALDAA